jgi:hypothetical protein
MPKRKRGALKGNQNARKHGFYSKVLGEAELLGRRFGLNRPISRTLAKRRGRNDRDNGWGKKRRASIYGALFASELSYRPVSSNSWEMAE